MKRKIIIAIVCSLSYGFCSSCAHDGSKRDRVFHTQDINEKGNKNSAVKSANKVDFNVEVIDAIVEMSNMQNQTYADVSLTIRNNTGEDVYLISGVCADDANRIILQNMQKADGIVSSFVSQQILIPAYRSITFGSESEYQLQLVGLKRCLNINDIVSIKLIFKGSKSITVNAKVN